MIWQGEVVPVQYASLGAIPGSVSPKGSPCRVPMVGCTASPFHPPLTHMPDPTTLPTMEFVDDVLYTAEYDLPEMTWIQKLRNGVHFLAGTILDHYMIEPTFGIRSGKRTGYVLMGPRGAVYTLTREARGALVPRNRSNSICMIRGVGWFWDNGGLLRPADFYDAVTMVAVTGTVQLPLPYVKGRSPALMCGVGVN